MLAKKQLRKPENWQDFEQLCKILWGEIWQCPEIKKNGRSGQDQSGVDVYGVPKGETQYYGIQCKGKDEYSHKPLTELEVDLEISNALEFKPPLIKFYFATTANKNAHIEEYIRIKDLENRSKGKFSISLFSWEDIVDLIDENKRTYDYYNNNNNYRTRFDIDVAFEDGSDTHRACIEYDDRTRVKPFPGQIVPEPNFYGFCLKLHNTGDAAIENPRLVFKIHGKFIDVSATNVNTISNNCDIEVDSATQEVVVDVKKSMGLDETYISWPIYIMPMREGSILTLEWKFTCNSFTKKDTLELILETQFSSKK